MVNRVVVRDRGANAVVRRLGAAKGPIELSVGVQGREASATHPNSSLTVAEIAALHEFGFGVPERSWLRDWFDENQASIAEDLRSVARGILLGRFSRERGLELLGLKYVGEIQRRIASNIPPPLDPKTIVAKGSSTPLIDTNQFRSAITYLLNRRV